MRCDRGIAFEKLKEITPLCCWDAVVGGRYGVKISVKRCKKESDVVDQGGSPK